jgi:MFS transporter, DHA1 family, inner membrane transport protein
MDDDSSGRKAVIGGLPETGSLLRLLAGNVAFAAGLFVHGFLYNFYLERLGFTPLEMGRAQAALTAGALLALLPAGRLVDRAGARTCMLLATGAAAAGLALGGLARREETIYAAALLAGAGTGAWRVAGGPLLLAATTPATRARAFSWNVGLMVAFGGALFFLGGAIPEWLDRQGWEALAARRAALVGAALVTLTAITLYAGLPPARPARPPDASQAPAANSGWSDARLLLVTGAVFVWMLAGGLTLPFFNLYFARGHGLSLTATGALMGGAQIATALALLGSAELSQRRGPRAALALWTAVLPPALLALALGPALGVAAALFVVQGFAAPATFPLVDQLVLERADPARRGHAASWRNVATEASGVTGAAAGGALLAAASFAVLFAVAGAVALLGALLLVLLFRGAAATSAADRSAAGLSAGS